MTVTCTICNKTEPTQEQFERFHIPTHEHVRMMSAYEKGIEAGEYKQSALITEQVATIARLTADAVLNDMAWKDNQAALNKQAKEIIALKKACIVYHNQIINMQKAEEK